VYIIWKPYACINVVRALSTYNQVYYAVKHPYFFNSHHCQNSQWVVLRIFTSSSILYFLALKLPPSSVLICSYFFCIIALGSGQHLLYRLGSGLVLSHSVEVNILNVSHSQLIQIITNENTAVMLPC